MVYFSPADPKFHDRLLLWLEPNESRFAHGHAGPPEEVIIDRTLSIRFIAALPEPERRNVEMSIRELIAATPAISRLGDVTFPYETIAYDCARLPVP